MKNLTLTLMNMSIFKVGYEQPDECIFVGEPSNLIDKYKLNTNAYG